MSKDPKWHDYHAESSEKPARPRLLMTMDTFLRGKTGHALDLGCGSGRDTFELLKRGWSVEAIDQDDWALESIANRAKSVEGSKIKLRNDDFEVLELGKEVFDLVNASYSLPFCKPDKFTNFWQQIVGSLKPGAYLSCEFFGPRDTWAQHPVSEKTLSFHSTADIRNLCQSLELVHLQEEERDAPSFAGPVKHWHVISAVARKAQLVTEL